ncbi:MAG: hypothetical protein JWO59_1708, partial [Chloroflexi bacterium]|nr:hypothetical protein [Chloroflexota bacterium]
MSSGPQRPSGQLQNKRQDQRGGAGPNPARRGPSRGHSAPERNPLPMILTIIGVIAVLAIAISIFILAQPTGPSSTASGTTGTPVPTVTVPTPQPTVKIGAVPSPSSAELAASTSACSPFLKAGNKRVGPKKWGAPPSMVIDASKHYQVKMYTTYGLITADILPKLAPITANN